ncbi:pirin family protein [Candidatus Marinarcus aquaticus]|uniref:Pirin family protein n=1 Tax=Candidatus Marinarcus aquaticus TaxID=2044504 RepID=A0A4Q0XQQ2_9BACT|nr:pirin family protein [Candidatus Marinarcus aquaticus]RXJ58109.1 hypothetical protein CRV04_06275 [Candidatus Marinarcus aquaticus]
MLTKIPKEQMFLANEGWLESRFHFSFAQYHDRHNMNFGVLRVLNDDIVHPNSGFGMHPHKDMEIISYIIDGEITHEDSMGNKETLHPGEVQYMSAGTGVLHSEYNHGKSDLRLLQIWILPPAKGLEPLYGSYKFNEAEKKNKLLHMVSSLEGNAPVKLHQDVNIFVSQLEAHKELELNIKKNRQLYMVQIKGETSFNDKVLTQSDALKVQDTEFLKIKALKNSEFLCIEMAQSLH